MFFIPPTIPFWWEGIEPRPELWPEKTLRERSVSLLAFVGYILENFFYPFVKIEFMFAPVPTVDYSRVVSTDFSFSKTLSLRLPFDSLTNLLNLYVMTDLLLWSLSPMLISKFPEYWFVSMMSGGLFYLAIRLGIPDLFGSYALWNSVIDFMWD